MAELQLDLPGIGQQKITLSDWKSEKRIFTFKSSSSDEENPWSCWDEYESPLEFGEEYSFEAMGYGKTEKLAIIDFCNKEGIDPPFWWNY